MLLESNFDLPKETDITNETLPHNLDNYQSYIPSI